MTAEQLQTARAAAWRQSGNPILTADDASAWLRETGLCLFLPRPTQIAAPAPSFIEATLGEPNATPSPAAIEAANELLLRLLAQDDAVALNLLGATGSQPDFVATPETLPFIYALRGDKEWKRGPRGKSSPLVIEVWKLLDKEGPLTTSEVKDQLGRELTEAAALRALVELWNTLRIEPVYREYASLEDPARWQPLDRARAKQVQAGATMSAGMAISALVSLYLQSSVAATGEEIEAFLSPLCSRSKVRDAVRGLSATRQLASVHIGGAELYHVEGSLPEFPAVEVLTLTRTADIEVLAMAEETAAAPGEEAAPLVAATPVPPRKKLGGLVRRTFAFRGEGKSEEEARKPFTAARRPGGASGGASRPGGRTMGSSRPGSTTRRPSTPGGSVRKPYGTRSAPPGSAGFNASKPWEEDRKPRHLSEGGERRPYLPRDGERKSFGDAGKRPYERKSTGSGSFGAKKPFGGKKTFGAGRSGDAGAERKGGFSNSSSYKPSGDRPFTQRPGGGAGKPFSDRKPAFGAGAGKPFGDRKPAFGGGARKPFVPRGEQAREGAGEGRKPAFGRDRKRGGDRPFAPRVSPQSGDWPFPPRPSGKPFGDREPAFGGARKPFAPRGEGVPARKPWAGRNPGSPAAGGERRPPFTPRGDRPLSGGAVRPSGDRPFSSRGTGKPFTPRDSGGAPPRRDMRASGSSYGRMDGGGPRPPYKPRTESGGGPDRPAANRPFPARPPADRPRPPGASNRPGGPGGPKSRTSPFTSSGKPRPGVKPTGRPGPRANRPPGAPGRPSKSAGPRRKRDDES